jgi:hypothetical protein
MLRASNIVQLFIVQYNLACSALDSVDVFDVLKQASGEMTTTGVY